MLSNASHDKEVSGISFFQAHINSSSHHITYDDLSDILEEYVQRHRSSFKTEDSSSQLEDDDSLADDYQPESGEECTPTWVRSCQASDSAAIVDVQSDIECSGK